MPLSTSCPSLELLSQLLQGSLPPETAEPLAQHLENCDRCTACASELPTESALIHAARAIIGTSGDEDTYVEQLIEQASTRILVPRTVRENEDELARELPKILAAPQAADEIGRLGSYRVLRVIGWGGMGVVLLAEDTTLHRRVALKTIRPQLAGNAEIRQRFLREAVAAAAVDDDHIVAIHQVAEDQGVPYLVMPLLSGASLQEHLDRFGARGIERALSMDQVLRIGTDVATGLAAAHKQKLIHRDIKPANIWLDASASNHNPTDADMTFRRAKLLDFGLASQLHSDVSLTQPGIVAGTPAYLSPEQIAGPSVDEHCDLFSLGCVLYEIATGTSPFAADNTAAVLHAVVNSDPLPPDRINPQVPADLSQLIMQLLEKKPARRPASAYDVAGQLRDMSQSRVAPSAASTLRRRSWGWLAAAAAVLGLMLAAAIFVIRSDKGVLIVETSDPQMSLSVNEAGGVTLRDEKTGRRYRLTVGRHRLPVGRYQIDVEESGSGVVTSTEQFSIVEGGTVRLSARVAADIGGEGNAEWVELLRGLPAEQQVSLIAEHLRKRNPEFAGELASRFANNNIIELELSTDHVADLSPIGGLPQLQKLVCRGSALGKGVLSDLSPLRNCTALRILDCGNNQVRDLSPLESLPLRELHCAGTFVEQLGPLQQLPLEVLDVRRTLVSDVSALRSLPLARLDLRGTYVHQLWPVESMPSLRILDCDFRPRRDAASLRAANDLRTINGMPAQAFWQKHEERERSLRDWLPWAQGLPEDQKAEAVTSKLRELNPGFQDTTYPSYTDGKLTAFKFFTDYVTDIEPLRALTCLELISLRGFESGSGGKLFDLDPLRDLPLRYLECSYTEVNDLSSLQDMQLQVLLCRSTRVRDLSPINELPLFYLDCSESLVADLTPLRNRPITILHIRATPIRDFSPLSGMPLRILSADVDAVRDEQLLKSFTTLETLNDKPLAEFWSSP